MKRLSDEAISKIETTEADIKAVLENPDNYFGENVDKGILKVSAYLVASQINTARKAEDERDKEWIERVEPIIQIAISSLKYCEERYSHDNMARLNVETGWQDLKKEAE